MKRHHKLIVGIFLLILISTIAVNATYNRKVVETMNKYCNLDGAKNIKDEYSKINTGFDGVDADLDSLGNRVDTIIATPVEGVSAQEIIDARDGKVVLGGRLDDFDAQLAESAKASRYGVDATIGTADATTLLNNYFIALKAKGIKYAIFDKAIDFTVDGLLTEARDLILLGKARIITDVAENKYITISDEHSYFNEKINSFGDKAQFIQLRKTILENSRPINVTVWGDSWSNFGSDKLIVNYKTMNGTQGSPNGLTNADGYVHRLSDILLDTFKDSNFNIYNRAIGGERLMSWNNNQTFNATVKTWIEHIKDTAPDMLIIAFGMNSYTYAESVKTAYTIKAITDYIKANFVVQPDLVFLTAPRPVLNLGDVGWGSMERQTSREIGANATRWYAKNVGGYVVDVSRLSDIKRMGVDFTRPYLNEVFFTNDEFIDDGCDGSVGTGVFTLSNSSQYLRLKNLKDFTIKFDLTFNNIETGNSLFIEYNKHDINNTNLLSVYPRATTTLVGKINNSNSWSDYTSWGSTTTATYSDTAAFTTTQNFIIKKNANVLEITLNGIVILKDNIYVNDSIGDIVFRLGGAGSTTTASISGLRLYKGMYQSFTPSLTEEEMWGLYIFNNVATKSKTGGNGVNHPSMLGLETIVMPCLREFVDDITKIVSVPLSFEQLNVMPDSLAFSATLTDTTYVFYNIPYRLAYKFGKLINSGGGTFTLNKNATSYTQRTLLAGNEFAIYYDGTSTQILIKSTTLAGWTFNSLLNI